MYLVAKQAMLSQLKPCLCEVQQFFKKKSWLKIEKVHIKIQLLVWVYVHWMSIHCVHPLLFHSDWGLGSFSKDASLVQPHASLTSSQPSKLIQNRHLHLWRQPKSKVCPTLLIMCSWSWCEWNHHPLPWVSLLKSLCRWPY